MKKIAKLVLMLSLVLSGTLCYAIGVARTENVKGDGDILTILKAQHGGADKSGCILPSINDHVLSVVFSENLGQITVEVSTTTGASVHYTSVLTPYGLQIYIPNAGDYVVTFTLSNGDEYYGEFTVTD